MAKVGVHLSFTFKLGAAQANNFCKVAVDVQDVDTELPLDAQLESVNDCLSQVWDYTLNKVDNEILEQVGERAGG